MSSAAERDAGLGAHAILASALSPREPPPGGESIVCSWDARRVCVAVPDELKWVSVRKVAAGIVLSAEKNFSYRVGWVSRGTLTWYGVPACSQDSPPGRGLLTHTGSAAHTLTSLTY